MPPEIVALIAAILSDTAPLPGALCRGHGETWDPPSGFRRNATAARLAFAADVCRVCPVLAECRAWVDGLPARRRPVGVTAGVLRSSDPHGRPRAAVAVGAENYAPAVGTR